MTTDRQQWQPPAEEAVSAWARLVRVQSRLLDRIQAALKAAELPPLSWYDVLLELHRSGPEGLRQYEIGQQVLLSKYNLSRLIDRLEGEALVERTACPEDGRGNRVRITAAGSRLLRRMWPVYGGVLAEGLESRLTNDELAVLAELLGKLTDVPTARKGAS